MELDVRVRDNTEGMSFFVESKVWNIGTLGLADSNIKSEESSALWERISFRWSKFVA